MDILTYAIAILIVILFVLVMAFKTYEEIKLKGLRAFVIKLIVKAENIFTKGMNTEKFDLVFENVYDKFPAKIKKFISVQNIKDFIQKTFDEIKVALDNEPKE